MGYNAIVVVCLDALGAIEKDPNWGKEMHDAISKFGIGVHPRTRPQPGEMTAHGQGIHIGAARILAVYHADDVMIAACAANSGTIINETFGSQTFDPETQLRYIEEMARDHGYKLVKLPKQKVKPGDMS